MPSEVGVIRQEDPMFDGCDIAFPARFAVIDRYSTGKILLLMLNSNQRLLFADNLIRRFGGGRYY
jgi:hypothetical protein